MDALKFTDTFIKLLEQTIQIRDLVEANSLVILIEGEVDFGRLKKITKDVPVIIVANSEELLSEAKTAGFQTVLIGLSDTSPVYDRITLAIIESIADDILLPGSRIVALYSGFDPNVLDSISVIKPGEPLERLTGKELRKLETKVPLRTLKAVVDLALEIGRDGREGKMVGTLFAIGDVKSVVARSQSVGFDPVKGYPSEERSIFDSRVREGIKEIAQLDGGFIVSNEGVVSAACRIFDTSTAMVSLSKGLGSRHWAAAAISSATEAVAVAVSESGGTIRIFVNGETVLRIESRYRRPTIRKEIEHEPPTG